MHKNCMSICSESATSYIHPCAGLPMTAKCTSIDIDNNSRPGADMEDGRGLRDIPVVPLPPPVPPSPLVPSAAQGVGSPSGGRAHRREDLPLPSSTPVESSLPPENSIFPSGKPLLPLDVNPLPGCSDPDFCVGGLPHLSFRAPGGLEPTREQIVWVTRR